MLRLLANSFVGGYQSTLGVSFYNLQGDTSRGEWFSISCFVIYILFSARCRFGATEPKGQSSGGFVICFHQRHVSDSHNVCNEHVCQHFLITSLSRLSCRMLPTTVARSNYTKTLSCFCVMNPEPLAYTDSPQTAILFSVMQIRNQPTVDSLFLVANPGLEPESPP